MLEINQDTTVGLLDDSRSSDARVRRPGRACSRVFHYSPELAVVRAYACECLQGGVESGACRYSLMYEVFEMV